MAAAPPAVGHVAGGPRVCPVPVAACLVQVILERVAPVAAVAPPPCRAVGRPVEAEVTAPTLRDAALDKGREPGLDRKITAHVAATPGQGAGPVVILVIRKVGPLLAPLVTAVAVGLDGQAVPALPTPVAVGALGLLADEVALQGRRLRPDTRRVAGGVAGLRTGAGVVRVGLSAVGAAVALAVQGLAVRQPEVGLVVRPVAAVTAFAAPSVVEVEGLARAEAATVAARLATPGHRPTAPFPRPVRDKSGRRGLADAAPDRLLGKAGQEGLVRPREDQVGERPTDAVPRPRLPDQVAT